MDKVLLVLLLLGAFPLLFFQAKALMCLACKSYKKGHCLVGKSNCTVPPYTGCGTKNFFLFSETVGWYYNHTELTCRKSCWPSHMYYGDLKVSTFCCKNQDFCNKHHGQDQIQKRIQ